MYRKAPFVTDRDSFERYPAVTLFLQAALVSAGHWAERFLKKVAVAFFYDIVWMLSTLTARG